MKTDKKEKTLTMKQQLSDLGLSAEEAITAFLQLEHVLTNSDQKEKLNLIKDILAHYNIEGVDIKENIDTKLNNFGSFILKNNIDVYKSFPKYKLLMKGIITSGIVSENDPDYFAKAYKKAELLSKDELKKEPEGKAQNIKKVLQRKTIESSGSKTDNYTPKNISDGFDMAIKNLDLI